MRCLTLQDSCDSPFESSNISCTGVVWAQVQTDCAGENLSTYAVAVSCFVDRGMPGDRRIRRFLDRAGDSWVVSRAGQAFVQSAELDFRTGVDDALRPDGDCGVAGDGGARFGRAVGRALAVCSAAWAESRVELDLLPPARDWDGCGGGRVAVVRDRSDYGCFQPGFGDGGVADGALLGVGDVCVGAERDDLEAEPERELNQPPRLPYPDLQEYPDYMHRCR